MKKSNFQNKRQIQFSYSKFLSPPENDTLRIRITNKTRPSIVCFNEKNLFLNHIKHRPMKINKLKLFSTNLNEQLVFYRDLLGFPLIEKTENLIRFQTGKTELIFEKSAKKEFYHFAFLIPTGQLEKSIRFLEKKGIELLRWDGELIAHFKNGRAVYFFDKDGNITEFIERPTLGFESDSEFSIDQILKINEIGLPVETPLEYSKKLVKKFNLTLADQSNFFETFCWAGDYEGVFIVTKIGRNWKPTQLSSVINDFEIEFEESEKVFQIGFKNNSIYMANLT